MKLDQLKKGWTRDKIIYELNSKNSTLLVLNLQIYNEKLSTTQTINLNQSFLMQNYWEKIYSLSMSSNSSITRHKIHDSQDRKGVQYFM